MNIKQLPNNLKVISIDGEEVKYITLVFENCTTLTIYDKDIYDMTFVTDGELGDDNTDFLYYVRLKNSANRYIYRNSNANEYSYYNELTFFNKSLNTKIFDRLKKYKDITYIEVVMKSNLKMLIPVKYEISKNVNLNVNTFGWGENKLQTFSQDIDGACITNIHKFPVKVGDTK